MFADISETRAEIDFRAYYACMKTVTRRWIRSVTGAALAVGLAVGIGGAVYASDSNGLNADIESFAAGKYQEELPPITILGNGKTAGTYRAETPLTERPDYLAVFLSDGQKAYVKLEDTFSAPVVPLGTNGPIELSESEVSGLDRDHEALIARANSKGEIWVNAYADDGVSIIGQWLTGYK